LEGKAATLSSMVPWSLSRQTDEAEIENLERRERERERERETASISELRTRGERC